MADALLIGGTSLSALGRIVQDFGSSLGGAPTVRNQADEVPRRRGSIAVDSITGSTVITVRMLLHGKTTGGAYTRPEYHTNAVALRKLVFNRGRTFTLTRTRDLTSGTQTHVATARYLRGLENIEQVAAHGGRVAFELEIFDGVFYDASQTLINPGSVAISGDADTRRIVLDLQEAGTLTNSTLGCSVTVTEAAVLTVESFTSAGGNISTMSHSGDDYWFALAGGVTNTITWTGTGSLADIAYNAAWL